jgi:dienelactone hydrolase
VNRSVVAAGLLTVAAAGTVGQVVRDWAEPGKAPSAQVVCAAAGDVVDALGRSVSDQVALRGRAAHLADVLIDSSAEQEDGASLATARRIVSILDDPDATVSDLAAAVDPVARQCPDQLSR